jgi:hypothetical protein
MRLALVEEYKNITQFYRHIQLVRYKSAQPIKAFAHVCPLMIQQIPGGMVSL